MKMAAEVRPDETHRDILQGDEPGASRNSILLASDSYEEIVNCFDKAVVEVPRERLPSGPILEIRETDQEKDGPLPLSRHVNNLTLDESSSKPALANDNVTESKKRTPPDLSYDASHELNGPNCDLSQDKHIVPSVSVSDTDTDNDNVTDSDTVRDSGVVIEQEAEEVVEATHDSESNNEINQTDHKQSDSKSEDVNQQQSVMGNKSSVNSAAENQTANSSANTEDQNLTNEPGPSSPHSPTEDEPDYVHSKKWREHKKHVFILSEAGKPIYSRYGEEDRLVTMMGVMQALISVIQHEKDTIRCIVAGEHKCVFLHRDHLMLVAVAATQESVQQLLLQLNYVYNQVLSVLTLSQLSRIFEQRHNYDLRRLLTGAEKFFDNLLNLIDHDPSFMLGAVRCLPLESSIRDTVAQTIAQHAKVKDLVFAILLADNQLVTLVRMKKYFLSPLDLHLVFNLVSASESFKTAESWTPICLPKFDSSGYLHAHISYLDEACHVCLLLLTVDRDVFFTLSECKHKIQEKLIKQHCLRHIADSISKKNYRIGDVGIQDLRHFVYKSRSTAQFTSPEFEAPYATQEDQERIFGLYQYLYQRVHSGSTPLKILFHVGPHETLLGWVTSGFELYAVFGPLVTKNVAINSVNKLLKWIKKEEDRLFILSSPTF